MDESKNMISCKNLVNESDYCNIYLRVIEAFYNINKLIDNSNKKHHATDYENEILRKCKELNGPVTTITELNLLMKNAQKQKMS